MPLSSECHDGLANPFRMDSNRITSHPHLLHAIMAVTSQHISKRNSDELMSTKMHDHWSAAIQMLSAALEQSRPGPLLDTIMVLMTYHVSACRLTIDMYGLIV